MRSLLSLSALPALLASPGLPAATEDLGNGFRHHGVATPVSNHRGIVSTRDGDGRDVALAWLFDHTGGYAILVLDAVSGAAQQVKTPFPPGGDCPYASLLSSRGKFYTHFNSWFSEFDPLTRTFSFTRQTVPQMAMSMTEDDQGRIWSTTYPDSGVAMYNPATGEFKDYGHVYKQNWRQYPRSIAADDQGWIYTAVGSTSAQIIALNPTTGQATPLLAEAERTQGSAAVYRDLNGKVYGQPNTAANDRWLELYQGQARPIGTWADRKIKPIITGSQGLVHTSFPSGRKLINLDTVEKQLVVEDLDKKRLVHRFDYTSEGAHIMGVAAAPDGSICGGTAFPMRAFRYHPPTDTWTNRASYGQWNTVGADATRFFVGGYGHGFLLEWDPSQPWVPTVKGQEGCNPQFLAEFEPDINRPHALLVHPDGRHVVLAGTPGYGYTGGGLLVWDRQTRSAKGYKHAELLPNHSTTALHALPGTLVLGGSTIAAGTGGEQKAKLAELYLFDLATGQIVWHEAPIPGVTSYLDFHAGPNGLVYGMADRTRFFVFDPSPRAMIQQFDTTATLGSSASQQGCRIFVEAPGKALYMLFAKGIAAVDPATHEPRLVAPAAVAPTFGGDWLNGRVYYANGSHLYSWQPPQ
ncbi:MAG: hypothetical protein IT204_19505 [Fimbriimonadaceae bacterium]|nr:hypothetical protein [Fimbriimonadaceae bacterium]